MSYLLPANQIAGYAVLWRVNHFCIFCQRLFLKIVSAVMSAILQSNVCRFHATNALRFLLERTLLSYGFPKSSSHEQRKAL